MCLCLTTFSSIKLAIDSILTLDVTGVPAYIYKEGCRTWYTCTYMYRFKNL